MKGERGIFCFHHRKLHIKVELIPKSLYDTLVHSVLPLEVVVQEPFPKNREKDECILNSSFGTSMYIM